MDWTPVGLFSKYFGASLADDPESGVHCTAGENQCPVCGEGAAQPLLATEGQRRSWVMSGQAPLVRFYD